MLCTAPGSVSSALSGLLHCPDVMTDVHNDGCYLCPQEHAAVLVIKNILPVMMGTIPY